MTIEIFMRKRAARPGEIGLFVETEIFQEEWSSIKIGEEVEAHLSVPVNEKYRKFFHALCGKLAEAVDWFGNDKDFAKEQVLLKCRHATYHHDKLRGKTEIRAKTTSKLSSDEWIRLLRRATYVAVSELMPGIEESVLRAEIEKMLDMKINLSAPPRALPEPVKEKPARKPRGKKADKPDPEPEAEAPRVPSVPSADVDALAEQEMIDRAGVDPTPPEEVMERDEPEGETAEAAPADRPPQTATEYIERTRGWIARHTDATQHAAAREIFNGEIHRDLRVQCRVPLGHRKMLERELDEHFEQLKAGGNGKKS